MHRWPPLQRRSEICWRNVKSMFSNCSEIFVIGTYWKTWYSMFIEQNLHDRLRNGPKLVTNAWIDWFHIFITRVNTNSIVIVGNTAKQCRLGTVSGLWLCGRSWRFKIHLWRNIVDIRKSHICSNKSDVQETNCCFSQFNRIWNHLVGHWTEIGWVACYGIMGSNCFCSWKCFSCFR